jgi:hypothetical protein
MSYTGKIILERVGMRVRMTVASNDLAKGLVIAPLFKIRSLHFGTKLRGMDIKKGEGYGWDGHDMVRAKRTGRVWTMYFPVRDNDHKNPKRLFIRGNCYIWTIHNEIYYFDLRKWRCEPAAALKREGKGMTLDIDLDDIPKLTQKL